MSDWLSKINSPEDLKPFSPDELVELAVELRQEIISAVSETGGHLASNLGAVELTVALHHVFDAPKDKIIWDVSHQTYCHKILTGRKEEIKSLRQYGGLSGFCKRTESEYDPFGAGHASTSISVALGFAAARDINNDNHRVVAILGDGAMTGGLAFEGMNNSGALKKDMLVVLNDNTWSISKNVGAISKYLTSILADEKFNKLRSEIWELTGKFKRRDRIRETIQRLENSIKGLLVPGMFFEKLGFRYFGPINGHDLPLLVKTLKDIKNISGPVMLHVATVKGKGYAPSEEDAGKYHGIGKFNKVTGKLAQNVTKLPSYTAVFGDTMVELAEENDKVVAITAAMAAGTGLVQFSEKFPEQFFDVGIAEAHAACFSSALAIEGIRPFLTIYSTFMQRAYDQIIHDMAIQKLPVVICMDRSGLAGNDGPTHHGVFDLAYLQPIPNITIAVPKDGNELRSMLHYAAGPPNRLEGPLAIRYPRDTIPVPMTAEIPSIDWGSWEWLSRKGEIVILAVGTMVTTAMEVSGLLKSKGIDISVINARFVKPMDINSLLAACDKASYLITIEEGSIRGGFGQSVAEYIKSNTIEIPLKIIGIPDKFITHGNRSQLLKEIGLNSESIAETIEKFLKSTSPKKKTNKTADSSDNILFQRIRFGRHDLTSNISDTPTSGSTGTESK